MNKTVHILKLLSKNRTGLTAKRIFNSIDDYESIAGLRVYLSTLVMKGFLRTDGKIECECCGSAATCYRISEKGRIKLGGYEG